MARNCSCHQAFTPLQQQWLERVQQQRAIAVIRAPEFNLGLKMAQAVAAGGMQCIEITWNSDRPQALISQLREMLPDCLIGVGTILNAQQLKEAIVAGAQYIFSPHTNPGLIEQALNQGVPMIPGALTPTEILTAWQAGATCVKVFPIQAVGGVEYLKAIQGPLSGIPLILTGGVNCENAPQFIQAGAIAVGLSGDLFTSHLLKAQNWPAIAQRASILLQHLQPLPSA